MLITRIWAIVLLIAGILLILIGTVSLIEWLTLTESQRQFLGLDLGICFALLIAGVLAVIFVVLKWSKIESEELDPATDGNYGARD